MKDNGFVYYWKVKLMIVMGGCLWIVKVPKTKLVGSLKVKSKRANPSRPLL